MARTQNADDRPPEGGTCQALDQDVDLEHYPRTVFYHVRDSQRLMGLMCIQSSRRWATAYDGLFLGEILLSRKCTTEYVSCVGLDGRLIKGLTAVHEELYEREESEVEVALLEP